MILPEMILTSRQNQICTESGIDSLERCLDKEYFKSYPCKIEYRYNSRGFRDEEWPNDLTNSVWCVGDSFTVGLGSCIEHTWVNILQSKLNRRCINISMDGASNLWIARKAVDILNIVSPKLLIIHWSYFFRDEDGNTSKSDEDRRLQYSQSVSTKQQLKQFFTCLDLVEKQKQFTHVVHSFIPNGPPIYDSARVVKEWDRFKGSSWPMLPHTVTEFDQLANQIKTELHTFNKYSIFRDSIEFKLEFNNSTIVIPELEQIDLARDGHHYDILTATNFVEKLVVVIDSLPVD